MQFKILEHHLHHSIVLPFQQTMKAEQADEQSIRKHLCSLAELFHWDEDATEPFDVSKPCFNSFVHALLAAGHEAMSGERADDDEYEYSLEKALEEARTQTRVESDQMKAVYATAQAFAAKLGSGFKASAASGGSWGGRSLGRVV